MRAAFSKEVQGLLPCVSRGEILVLLGRGEHVQGRTDHLETRALPEGLGSVGGPMRCPWYLFHRLF
ncbi:unnamed protein product [Staurois parvus]|uniref:Uncharacterized protein n=1 Tax=Staurois parvus TaxID=386267 RepID=A0ABN9E7D1_9NEOB|nr:unnamed protein product [Staurois parvus]